MGIVRYRQGMNSRPETRHLVYFVTVAEELHFGRAAARLRISQPVLSRAIAQLERRLGAQLLQRTSRRVVLTASGETFLIDSRGVLEALDLAARRAHELAATGHLRLAVRPGTGGGVVADLLEVHNGRGDRGIDLVFTRDPETALRSGSADAAVVCGGEDLHGLTTVALVEERPVALVATRDRLASKATVTLDELHAHLAFAEVPPDAVLDEIIDLVAVGRLVAVVGDTVVPRLVRGVTALPVSGLDGTHLVLAWPSRSRTPGLRALADAGRAIAAKSPAAWQRDPAEKTA